MSPFPNLFHGVVCASHCIVRRAEAVLWLGRGHGQRAQAQKEEMSLCVQTSQQPSRNATSPETQNGGQTLRLVAVSETSIDVKA